MKWHVLYTKSRHEKLVAEKLSLLGLEVYCPMLKTKKKWSDRWKWVEEPLFKSYCFVQVGEAEREKVFTVKGVVRYLFYCGQPAIIRPQEINVLKEWLNEYDHSSIESLNFSPKDKVLLRSGALMDQQAEVLSSNGNYLTLLLENLGMQLKVDLRKNIVDRIGV